MWLDVTRLEFCCASARRSHAASPRSRRVHFPGRAEGTSSDGVISATASHHTADRDGRTDRRTCSPGERQRHEGRLSRLLSVCAVRAVEGKSIKGRVGILSAARRGAVTERAGSGSSGRLRRSSMESAACRYGARSHTHTRTQTHFLFSSLMVYL